MSSHSSTFKADYSSPQTTKAFAHDIPSVEANATPTDISSNIAQIRNEAKKLQEEINTFLTAQMEEDKAKTAGGKSTNDKESKEEENYGEEVVDED
jgi:hypothetical protein